MIKQTILKLAKQLQEGYGDVINVTFHEGGDKYDIREGMKLSNSKTATLRGTCHSEVIIEGRASSRPSLSVVQREEPLRIEPWLRKALDEQKLRRKAEERRRYYAGK